MPAKHTPLKITVPTGAMTLPLAALLAKQREEEPETPLRLIETTMEDQLLGLEDGRYCLGFSLTQAKYRPTLQATPLWRDEVMVAVPAQSPLLAFDKIPLKEATRYPLILWNGKGCEVLRQQIDSLLGSAEKEFHVAERVSSFGLMAILITAGYGIGFCTQSWISASRMMDIEIRPLADQPHYVTTYLIHPRQSITTSVDRVIQRALKLQSIKTF